MSLRKTPWCIGALLLLAGCSQTSISGTYLAKGNAYADLLQLTQSKEGHLIGTLSHAAMKPSGTIERTTDGVTGMVDGKSITLVTNAPLSLGASMSGTVDGQAITITFGPDSERFTLADAAAFQTAVGALTSQGVAIQQQQAADQAKARKVSLLSDQDASVASLNQRLNEYATRVTGPAAIKEIDGIRAAHNKILDQAGQLWKKEQTFPRGSYQAGQVAYAIGQASYQIDAFHNRLEGVPEQGRSHIKTFDYEIAGSVCRGNADPALVHCAEQPAAIAAYQAARPVVLKRMVDIEGTLSYAHDAMKTLVDQADAYSSGH